ncbi:MAG: hypothetical protein WC384_06110 [Prolixibacteraceae bacterium]|jgi:hypothetical protein
MEDIEIINLWKAQNEKIEQSLAINRQLLKEVVNQKAESALKSLIYFKRFGIVAAIFYLLTLAALLFYAIANYSPAANYFIISMGAIFLINVKALADYIRHLVLAGNINYNGSVTEIQKQLNKLHLSIIQHSRVISLQFPFWTTFYLSNTWFPQSAGAPFLIFQIIFTVSSVVATVWFFKNQTFENMDKKWVQRNVAAAGGKSVSKAMAFYREIEEFGHEEN